MLPVCVGEVTTAGNQRILSLNTISILFPVQKTMLPRDAAWRPIFFYLSVQFWWWNWRTSFMGRFTTSGMFQFFSNCSHYSQHYHAGSELFCKVVPRQRSPGSGAISQLHQLEFTIRGQSTQAFLRCGPLVAGKGCIKGVWTVKTTERTPRGLPVSTLSSRSYYNDFQWHQFDLKY